MHKIILKLFDFLKSCTQFLKILIVFSILMLILYWIQNLTGDFWAWFGFMNRYFDFFLNIGEYINSGQIMLFDAVFEFKYFIALIIFVVFYAIVHFMYIGLEFLQDTYGESRKIIRKFEENRFNKTLEKQNITEQKKLKRYQVYVETQVKSKYAHREYNIDMEEQNKIMLKFLVEKTGVCPQKFQKGFLFTFGNFREIDGILDVFTKITQSTAPIDYIICVQILGIGAQKETKQIESLINLKMLNKIIMMADTAYRYGFNDICKFKTLQVGLYQKNNDTFEVHEFVYDN